MTVLRLLLVTCPALAAARPARQGRVVRRRLPRAGEAHHASGRWWAEPTGLDRRAATVAAPAAVVAVVLSAWLLGGAALLVLSLVALATTFSVWFVRRRGRQVQLVEAQLPALLDTLAGSVRSGASLALALREATSSARGPLRADLGAVLEAVDSGSSLSDALAAWGEVRPSGRVRLTVAALTLALSCGGAEARTLDGVAATLRDRAAVEGELLALSAQARSSAAVMILAPAAFVLLTSLGDPSVGAFYLRTPAGFACLVAGIALDAVGGGWMWWLARAAA